MKKFLIKSISVVLFIVVVISSMNMFVSAASSTIILSANKITVGDSVSVQIKYTADEPMLATSFSLSYNSSILQFESCDQTSSGGAGIITVAFPVSNSTSTSCTLKFKAIATGTAYVSTSDLVYVNIDEEKIALQNQGANISVITNEPAVSSNANLSALSVSAGRLSPSFSASRTSYTVNVKNSVTNCEIYATAADSGAKVAVSGSSALKVGTNTRTVTVTAPSGDTKNYTINIVRSETDDTVSSTPETTEENPLIIADGNFASYTVLSDISSVSLFKGFIASTADYNGTQVGIATDEKGEYKLYFLKAPEGEETVICTYDEEEKVFKKISYITQGDYTYIIADLASDLTVPTEYYTTNTKIGNSDIKCYANTATDDFYYIYCYTDGKYGFYRYDTREGVLQRYPELEPVNALATAPEETDESILDRFKSLTINSKIILICLLFVVLAVIALIVLLIIKLATKKKNNFDDEVISDEDFEDIAINDNFFITNSNEPQADQEEE